METIKKYLFSMVITLGLILAFAFFINIFNYFDILSGNFYKVILVILSSLSIATGSFLLGKKALNKGYLEGIKFGVFMVLIFFVISFLAFDNGITVSSLIYYLILVIASSVGSMFGINKKTNDNL